MKRKVLFGTIGFVLLSAVGLFVGMNIGGNYFPDFEFMGGRGYEATGYLGAIIGAVAGVLLGTLLEGKRSNKDNEE